MKELVLQDYNEVENGEDFLQSDSDDDIDDSCCKDENSEQELEEVCCLVMKSCNLTQIHAVNIVR